jgi:integron integrase
LDFLEFASARRLSSYDLSHVSLFLNQMERAGKERFQIDQARWSLLLFLREVQGQAPGPFSIGPDPGERTSPNEPSAIAAGAASRPQPSGNLALLARLEDEARLRHLSPKTLKAYLYWAKAFLKWTEPFLPGGLTAAHARDFLVGLAHSGISASTQNQAFSAMRFLFASVLRLEFAGLQETPRAPGRVRFPDALSREEAAAVLRCMRPPWKLAAQMLYGCGFRLREALSLRVQDIDFAAGLIRTYNAKGSRSRAVPLPRKLAPVLDSHLRAVRAAYEADLRAGFAGAFLPDGLERKLPRSALDWPWQWVFPAQRLTRSEADGKPRRYHLHETGLQKEIKRAAAKAGLAKRVSPHTFRHSFATEMLRMGYDIRTVQDLLGHADLATTMIYTHVLAASSGRVLSPLDL